jgi:hypothetical protein
MPQRPPANRAGFSLKPLEVAPGGPNWRSASPYQPMARRHSGVSIRVRHWPSNHCPPKAVTSGVTKPMFSP